MIDFKEYNYAGNVINGPQPYGWTSAMILEDYFVYNGSQVKVHFYSLNEPKWNITDFVNGFKLYYFPLTKFINLNESCDFYITFINTTDNTIVYLNGWWGIEQATGKCQLYLQLSNNHVFNTQANYSKFEMPAEKRCFISISNDFIWFCDHIPGNVVFVQGFKISDLSATLGTMTKFEYSESFGKPSNEEGYNNGSFDDSSDVINTPTVPTIGYISSGGGAYKLSSGELNSLVNEIFVDYTPIESGDTGLEKIGIMLENVALTLQQLLNSQFVQYVTDVHVVPVAPSVGNRANIKLGSRTMNTTSTPVIGDIVVVDCGTLNIGEYYSNFIDYVGTVCKLYLPFIGFVDVKNEWFQGGFLNVTYHFNVIDGTFMSFIKATSSKSNLKDTIVASYGGSCCVHLPFVGADYSNVLSGLVSTVNGASSIVGSGNIGGAVSSATHMLNSLSGNVNGSNSYNSNSAFLGIRTPYLYIERVVADFSQTYAKENGLPLNVSLSINSLKGYTEIENIHLDNVNCTDEERSELENLLKNGVVF